MSAIYFGGGQCPNCGEKRNIVASSNTDLQKNNATCHKCGKESSLISFIDSWEEKKLEGEKQ